MLRPYRRAVESSKGAADSRFFTRPVNVSNLAAHTIKGYQAKI